MRGANHSVDAAVCFRESNTCLRTVSIHNMLQKVGIAPGKFPTHVLNMTSTCQRYGVAISKCYKLLSVPDRPPAL